MTITKTKTIALLTAFLLILSLTACSAKKPDSGESDNTPAGTLESMFTALSKEQTDIESIVNELIKVEGLPELNVIEVKEGPLNGFKGEIKGFQKGMMFGPWISSIPFIGYVFETDAPDNLSKLLKENADLNWNICTAADELKIKTEGNLVFICMAPYSFE